MNMDEVWKEIIELSDCPYIQDFAFKNQLLKYLESFEEYPIFISGGHVYNKHWQYIYMFPNNLEPIKIVWLSISIRITTGNIWIDELLIDKLGYRKTKNSMLELSSHFSFWRKSIRFDHDYSDIILKLVWLRRLIEDE